MLRDTKSCDGLSPRVRGNPHNRRRIETAKRSIPACAGEPELEVGELMPASVYPRVCGGTRHQIARLSYSDGLSPRVRGNLPVRSGRIHRPGSIPACAGEPPPGPRV